MTTIIPIYSKYKVKCGNVSLILLEILEGYEPVLVQLTPTIYCTYRSLVYCLYVVKNYTQILLFLYIEINGKSKLVKVKYQTTRLICHILKTGMIDYYEVLFSHHDSLYKYKERRYIQYIYLYSLVYILEYSKYIIKQ